MRYAQDMVTASEVYVVPRQTIVGLALAAALIGAWIGLHVYGVYLHRWSAWSFIVAPVCVAVQTWLSVGLFIVAHDAMHGSLAPGRPRINTAVGQLCLAIYAGFRFDRLKAAHFEHHRAPGTPGDPDYHPDDPTAFRAWFLRFLRTYFGVREMAVITVYVVIALLLGAHLINLLVFWAVPALLSAFQLFTFGTWLPHRSGDFPFPDHHNARSSQFGSVLSLLTCFHFGRHHEHHREPWRPWWRLDRGRKVV